MPYFDEDEDAVQGAVPTAPTGGAVAGGGGPSAPAAPQPKGRFVGIGEYMGLNQGAANRMAHDMGNKVNEDAAGADRETKLLGASFEQSLKKAASGGANGGFNGSFNGRYENLSDALQEESNAKAAGDEIGKSTYNDVSTWNPQGLASAQKNVNNAVDQLGQSKGNVSTLVEDSYGTGKHSQGELGWDAALAGNAGADRFTDLRQRYSGLSKLIAGTIGSSAAASQKERQRLAAQQQAAGTAAAGFKDQMTQKNQQITDKYRHGQKVLQKAKENGYQGNDPVAARGYLLNLERQHGEFKDVGDEGRFWADPW
jgi:hypothetical protein